MPPCRTPARDPARPAWPVCCVAAVLPARPSPPRPIRDGDGLPNTFERDRSRTSPTSRTPTATACRDAKEDPDGDRLTNRDEYLVGHAPADGRQRRATASATTSRIPTATASGTGASPAPWSTRARPTPMATGSRTRRRTATATACAISHEQNRGTHPTEADTDGDGYTRRAPRSRPAPIRAIRGEPPSRAPPAARRPLPGAPACPIFPASQRLEHRGSTAAPVARELGDDDRRDRARPRPAHGLRVVCRVRHPVPGRDRPSTPRSTVTFEYDDESDQVGYPIPASPARSRAGRRDDGDRHILMVDRDACRLYELFAAQRRRAARGTRAAARPGTCARTRFGPPAGRAPTRPGCRSCPVSSATTRSPPARSRHALRFTTNRTRDVRTSTRPATRRATSTVDVAAADGPAGPTQGRRTTRPALSPHARVIAEALKRYGMILADNGSPWYISGMSDPRFDDDVAPRARRHHRARPRGRRHERAGQRAVGTRSAAAPRHHWAKRPARSSSCPPSSRPARPAPRRRDDLSARSPNLGSPLAAELLCARPAATG